MTPRNVAGAGLVSVTLGALGCGEPARPSPLDATALFSPDARSDPAWRRFLEPRELHAAWAPSSTWRPYYKPTLIAAVAVVKDAAAPVRAETDGLEAQLSSLDLVNAAVFVDLPGEQSVAWGAALLAKGFQPVVTFNNWPHQKGLLKLERALGALLYHADTAAKTRPQPGSPPVFLLEGDRLADKRESPGPDVFDNRYFHANGEFPDAMTLQGAGLTRIVYVNPRGATAGNEEDDLNAYFHGLRRAGLRFTYVMPSGTALAVRDVEPASRSTIFDPATTARYASGGTGHAHRPYGHYRTYHQHAFWSSSSGTWGSGSSGGGGRSSWST